MQVLVLPLLCSCWEEAKVVAGLLAPAKPYVVDSEVVPLVVPHDVLAAVDSVVGSAVSPAVGPAVRLVVDCRSAAAAAGLCSVSLEMTLYVAAVAVVEGVDGTAVWVLEEGTGSEVEEGFVRSTVTFSAPSSVRQACFGHLPQRSNDKPLFEDTRVCGCAGPGSCLAC